MPYRPPHGWVELTSRLERETVFHESRTCAEIGRRAPLVEADRPGRSRECPRCVRSTARGQLAS